MDNFSFRIGHGYDVHRLVPGRKLIIGGIDIPFGKGLEGHSDADVLVHAIMDALLGAAALGDLGKHFPDNDEEYKDISSIKLLGYVSEKLNAEGYAVGNIDCTLVAQAPKIGSYVPYIRDQIADTLGISFGLVSVKATTEERLGFTGSGDGIAAHAVCLIYRK